MLRCRFASGSHRTACDVARLVRLANHGALERGISMTCMVAAALGAALGPSGAAPHAADPPILPMSETEQAHPPLPEVLTQRDRAKVVDAILADRLETVIPRLMREQGVDMWVLVAREYLEDPVVATMLDGESMRARRRTILVFHDPGAGKPVERLTVS